jgi:hypothetical protein
MQIHFRDAENQERWVWTEGLQALGQQEMAVQISWSENDLRDKLVIQLFRFLENYISNQPKRILPAQTFRYGWSMLRFVSDAHNFSGAGPEALLIEENQLPFSQVDPLFISGVTHTIDLMQLQHEAMHRAHITGDANYPSPFTYAIVCRRIDRDTIQHLRPLMVHRSWEPDSRRSGWFIGCCDKKHDHGNPEELGKVHLLHLVEQFPALFPYLAMPIGYLLMFGQNQAIIFHPGEQQGRPDPVPLLSLLPC